MSPQGQHKVMTLARHRLKHALTSEAHVTSGVRSTAVFGHELIDWEMVGHHIKLYLFIFSTSTTSLTGHIIVVRRTHYNV